MYSYSALEKSRKSEAAQPKRSVPTYKPLQAKEKDNGRLFGDTVHRRVMRGLSSGKQSTSPYLRGSSANAVQLKGIVQRANGRNAFVGNPSGWHIHYGDHIKCGKIHDLKVEFGRKKQKTILVELGGKINSYNEEHDGFAQSVKTDQDFKTCIDWIKTYIPI